MRNKGFTLIELVIVVAVLGILALLAMQLLNPDPEAKLIACCASASAMETLVEQAMDQTWPYTPTWEEVQKVAGSRWDEHYHYVPNSEDTNNGHGNDLDICDDGNPGASIENRDCLDIKYIIVCDHDHSRAGAGYVGVLSGHGPIVFKGDPEHRFVGDLHYWQEIRPGAKDPNLQKWIGRY